MPYLLLPSVWGAGRLLPDCTRKGSDHLPGSWGRAGPVGSKWIMCHSTIRKHGLCTPAACVTPLHLLLCHFPTRATELGCCGFLCGLMGGPSSVKGASWAPRPGLQREKSKHRMWAAVHHFILQSPVQGISIMCACASQVYLCR